MGTYFLAFLPNSLPAVALALPAILGTVGIWQIVRHFGELRWQRPQGLELLAPILIAIAGLFALVSTLAPSDASDWDSLAYHLAVPKLWLSAGQITYLPFIHHSNFPFTADSLYLGGLAWGGESGAKAFQLAYYSFGVLTVFGFARGRYGERAGWLAALAFALVPVVLWEIGSAYIDVAHGLYLGAGVLLYATDVSSHRGRVLVLVGLCLGFALGTKYTGLQELFAFGVAAVIAGMVGRTLPEGMRSATLACSLALLIGAPWYIKNAVVVGNPVYPFFYERLGGRNWDQRRADIYRNEQQTFGVGRTGKSREPIAMGHAVLGLAYQPGRFVNPSQDRGGGTPLGAVGIAVLMGLLLWPITGRSRRSEMFVLLFSSVNLVLWFLLSQQSRYIVPLALPLSVLAGGLTTVRAFKLLAPIGIGLQSLYTLYLVQSQLVVPKLPVVFGQVSAEQYRKATVPFAEATSFINTRLDKSDRVALYDEVFGYLLDVPYIWANPGHSTLIDYDGMSSGREFADGIRKNGATHVYINLSPMVKDREFSQRWLTAMQGGGWAEEERRALLENWETKWQVLLADAVQEGHLRPVQQFRSGILFEVNSGA
jgi:hypothetical protein